MAGSGLLAGLQGYAQIAEGPAKRLSDGISGAVETGLAAYGTTSRVRQGEEEGQRSQQRLDMAQSLLPGQLRAQELGNDAHSLALKEAGNKIAREEEARAFGRTIQERMGKKPEEGGYATPEDFQLDIVNMSMRLGDVNHVKDALRDYKLLLDKSETSKQLSGAISSYLETTRKASEAKTPEERIQVGLEGLTGIYKNYPLGATHPLMGTLTGNVLKHTEDTQPKAVSEAVKKYQEILVANPRLTEAQAWSRAHEGLDPGFWPAMEKLKPKRIVNLEAAEREEAVHAARARADQPGKVELERVKGEEARKTEREKEKGREARDQAKLRDEEKANREALKNLQSELNNLTNNLSRVDAFGNQVLKGDERMQVISRRDLVTAEVDRLRAKGTPEVPAAPPRPTGLSAARLGEVRTALQAAEKAKGSKLTSMAAVDQYLNDPRVQGYLSAEDIAAIRAEYAKKFGGK